MNKTEFSINEEVRDGVLVSKELKSVWKVLIGTLEAFIAICEKHGLNYFMDGGSLLGTVRHKGFIPWDDDIDVAMPRKDYDRFLQIAREGFRYPLEVQNSLFDQEYTNGYTRILNVNTAAINYQYAERGFKFNMGLGIDIFPIDPMPTEKLQRDRIWKKMIHLRAIRHYVFNRRGCGLRFILHKLAAKCIWTLLGNKRLFNIREGVFRRLNLRSFEKCATCPAEFGWAAHSHRERSWYDGYLEMPFEYLMVRVPIEYEKMLTQIYGTDWRTPKRGLACHSGLIIDARRSYKEILQERFGYGGGDL